MRRARAGQPLVVDIDTPSDSSLDSLVFVYDAAGNAIAANDDDSETVDSLLIFKLPANGDYCIWVGGFPNYQDDPHDSGSGDGAGTEGNYDLTLEVHRPGPQSTGAVPTLFLDFDGERVNTGIFGGPGVRRLSPLRAFLGRWGIPDSQYDALQDRIVATVVENVRRDYAAQGVRVRVLNSRDNPDPARRCSWRSAREHGGPHALGPAPLARVRIGSRARKLGSGCRCAWRAGRGGSRP